MFPWTRPLTNLDIENVISRTPLKSIFRGTFSRDELLRIKPKRGLEAGVINLSRSDEEGSHWTAWFKRGGNTIRARNVIWYFDSYGNLTPPIEFIKYASKYEIHYNFDRQQNFNTVICGQLCLLFIYSEYYSK